ncbi:DNA-(Apurinic or apyrimidinic site) lyase 2 [Tolypocladium paradoxum]|uniref:DNA-(apurinic or apyrimidinic site) endonuclease 2 n=1 Tax=Tolypocladium paradoxum TaxID=94208 RepID=A0A2S4KRT1_9HYPO|nr:DNA-(Apurinic or apyrimidinic site) lyase 2 [Tolypocladium paradoxum]
MLKAQALSQSALRDNGVSHNHLECSHSMQKPVRVSAMEGATDVSGESQSPAQVLRMFSLNIPGQAMFEILEADIVVMQETKIQRKDLQDDMVLVPGWDVFFSLPRHKKGKLQSHPVFQASRVAVASMGTKWLTLFALGYSGVAIYTRNATCAPIRAEEGVTGVLCAPRSSTKFRELPDDQQIGGYPRPGQLSGNIEELDLDSEGRCVILEFPAFVLLGVYSPANRNESRDDFRVAFLEALDVRIRNLAAAGKQVVLTGDLNVIRSVADSTHVAEHLRKEGMTLDDWMLMPSRRIFNQLIFEGTVLGQRDEGRQRPVLWDLCRYFHPNREGMNTCWDTKRNTRPANNGSRIDYVLCSDGLKSWFTHANIQEGLMGSDHCPVFATMADTVAAGHRSASLADLMNPAGMFTDGKRVREWSQKDILPLSAKLIPEFDRRQSIRDMLTKKSERAPVQSALNHETSNSSGSSLVDQSSSDALQGASDFGGDDVKKGANPGITMDSGLLSDTQRSSQSKRPPGFSDSTSRLPKRARSAVDSNGAKAKATPSQKTLQGFFKPVGSSSAATIKNDGTSASITQRSTGLAAPVAAPKAGAQDCMPPSPPARAPLSAASEELPAPPSKIFDPVEARESWSKLLGKRVLPRCEHNEPCISLVTKKPGINCGRSFYICPRPLGPTGEKEKGSEWRCGTFIWSSDWNGSSP